VTINRGTAAKGKTVVGDNCLIMAYCHVAHDCILGNTVIMANACQLAGEVEIDDFAILRRRMFSPSIYPYRIPRHATGGSKIGKMFLPL